MSIIFKLLFIHSFLLLSVQSRNPDLEKKSNATTSASASNLDDTFLDTSLSAAELKSAASNAKPKSKPPSGANGKTLADASPSGNSNFGTMGTLGFSGGQNNSAGLFGDHKAVAGNQFPLPEWYTSLAQPLTTNFTGSWELFSKDAGICAMHMILLPNNQVVMYDATIWQISTIKLPQGVPCRDVERGKKDCWSHAIFFDIYNGNRTPLRLDSDTWCSAGALDVDGNLVSTGGDKKGSWTVRFLKADLKADWREYKMALKDARWYATSVTLDDGRFVIIGGRDVYSYEFIPEEGKNTTETFPMPFLEETKDPALNNLYPFVHLSTDGNVYVFANNRSILLDAKNNKVLREYPVLPGGSRGNPATGMSALLPIIVDDSNKDKTPADVLVCGGSTPDAFFMAETKKIYVQALTDCNRIRITDDDPKWRTEQMPSPRMMGDMVILPNGQVIILNGCKNGTAGWGDGKVPNYTPVLYTPEALMNNRFQELNSSTIPRMYHSTAILLPDARILVAGSNSNNGYLYNVEFPTELRVEKFAPPYMDSSLDAQRPAIVGAHTTSKLNYGKEFNLRMKIGVDDVKKEQLIVTMYPPPFTTHGITMDQRLVVLQVKNLVKNNDGSYDLKVNAPPTGAIAPQGYYLLYPVYQGIPSTGMWVQLK
ncbi:hypothetical protein ACFE04_012535 [Oxalis oulophora]